MANPSSSSGAPLANSVSIISPHFCAPYPFDLAVVGKVFTLGGGNFVVRDINGDIVFKVKRQLRSIPDRLVLLDAAGNPIVTLKHKSWSAHGRWQVFRGDSTDSSNLIFSAKRSSLFQLKTELDVFLANNINEEVCDFKVKASWLGRSCIIYAGESSTIVAQMRKKYAVETIFTIGKNKFMVTVYPNVDYAFIVALIVILDGINSEGA